MIKKKYTMEVKTVKARKNDGLVWKPSKKCPNLESTLIVRNQGYLYQQALSLQPNFSTTCFQTPIILVPKLFDILSTQHNNFVVGYLMVTEILEFQPTCLWQLFYLSTYEGIFATSCFQTPITLAPHFWQRTKL